MPSPCMSPDCSSMAWSARMTISGSSRTSHAGGSSPTTERSSSISARGCGFTAGGSSPPTMSGLLSNLSRPSVRPTRPFTPLLYHLTVGIVPADLASQAGFGQAPVGTGPFRFTRWGQNEEVELEAFPRYFGGGPRITRLRLRIIPDATIRFLELKKGDIELLLGTLTPETLYF